MMTDPPKEKNDYIDLPLSTPPPSPITFSKVDPPETDSNLSKPSVSTIPNKKKFIRKIKPLRVQSNEKKSKHVLKPLTNHWGYTLAQNQTGKQVLVMLEGPTVPQDILNELKLNSSQREQDDGRNSEDDDFQDFPQSVQRSRMAVTLVSSHSLKSRSSRSRLAKGAKGDNAKKIKGKLKKKKKKIPSVSMVTSAGDACSTYVCSKTCTTCSSCSSGTSLPEQEIPKWMDDEIASFIRLNIKSPRLERECGMRSCTEWLQNYNRKYRNIDQKSSSSSVGEDTSESETENIPSYSPAYTEIGDANNKMQIRYYPDFSDFFGEIPIRQDRPPSRLPIGDIFERSASFEFFHNYDNVYSEEEDKDDYESTEEVEDNSEDESTDDDDVPTFDKLNKSSVQKALAKLDKIESTRTFKAYHFPEKTPLYCCAKAGPPPDCRKTSSNPHGPPLGPFYTCPIDHITGIIIRKPKIKPRKRCKPFDPGRRPHFLPYYRNFGSRKEVKVCCSCDKWRGRLGLGNHCDTENYHQNYLNYVTYNKDAQIPCRSDRCERCKFLATRSSTDSSNRVNPIIMKRYSSSTSVNKRGAVLGVSHRRTLVFKKTPSRQHLLPFKNIKLTAPTLASKAKITPKKILPSPPSTQGSNSAPSTADDTKINNSKPDWKS